MCWKIKRRATGAAFAPGNAGETVATPFKERKEWNNAIL